MVIREETPADGSAVRSLVIAAFDQRVEADLVDALRDSGDVVISLVAERDGRIVGHIVLSKLQAPHRCLALAPVSVAPSEQNRGIGSSLIWDSIARARGDGWRAVFVLGDPKYYERFGFSSAVAGKFKTNYPKPYFMALELLPSSLNDQSGEVIYASPFRALE